jgi:hypothetical protein
MENYEFNEKQNGVFRLLQMRMRFVSVIFILIGVLNGIFILMVKIEVMSFSSNYTIIGTIFSVFLIITGIFLWKAANAFHKIVKTQGHDIEILMDAVRDLYLAFDIQMWMILIGIFFMIIASVFIRDFAMGFIR